MISELRLLEVLPGEEARAEHMNRLSAEIARCKLRGGPGVRVRQLDTHQVVTYHAPRRTISHAWKPTSARTSEGKPGLRLQRGLVEGIEPKVGNKRMSDPDSDAVMIPGYGETGDCLVYVEVRLSSALWTIQEVTLAAYAEPPPATPFVGRKLVCIAEQTGALVARAFFDFGFAATDRKPGGRFKAWWWAR